MDANKNKANHLKINKTLKALSSHGFETAFVESKEEALVLVKVLVEKNSKTSSGGSVTLKECGIEDYLKKETKYSVEKTDVYTSEFFLSSVNALTENGEIYEVDGRGNRTSAILYGPEKVILVVGKNKIVKDLDEAVKRVKREAAPPNAIRLSRDTPCSKTGECILSNGDFASGCYSDECICSSALIIRRQHAKDRITVIIVGEDLGY